MYIFSNTEAVTIGKELFMGPLYKNIFTSNLFTNSHKYEIFVYLEKSKR